MSYTTLDDLIDRARTRLDAVDGPEGLPEGGDLDLVAAPDRSNIRPAAVLVPLIPRASGATALLTTRPDTMPTHPGQVAFPGGKMDRTDGSLVDAALREACEEVGLARAQADVLARGAPYITGTAFRITPVLAVLPADFEANPHPEEVANVFEVPLSRLFDPVAFTQHSAQWGGRERRYYAMTHQGHYIWGVTAGIIRALRWRLYSGEA